LTNLIFKNPCFRKTLLGRVDGKIHQDPKWIDRVMAKYERKGPANISYPIAPLTDDEK